MEATAALAMVKELFEHEAAAFVAEMVLDDDEAELTFALSARNGRKHVELRMAGRFMEKGSKIKDVG
jgi:hypothetical protein